MELSETLLDFNRRIEALQRMGRQGIEGSNDTLVERGAEALDIRHAYNDDAGIRQNFTGYSSVLNKVGGGTTTGPSVNTVMGRTGFIIVLCSAQIRVVDLVHNGNGSFVPNATGTNLDGTPMNLSINGSNDASLDSSNITPSQLSAYVSPNTLPLTNDSITAGIGVVCWFVAHDKAASIGGNVTVTMDYDEESIRQPAPTAQFSKRQLVVVTL